MNPGRLDELEHARGLERVRVADQHLEDGIDRIPLLDRPALVEELRQRVTDVGVSFELSELHAGSLNPHHCAEVVPKSFSGVMASWHPRPGG